MGQAEIYTFLKKHPGRFFNAHDLGKYLHIRYDCISRKMKKMTIYSNILLEFRMSKGKNHVYKYYIKYVGEKDGRQN